MVFGIKVQLPVSVAFGTNEEFDLRVRLEGELGKALTEAGAGECVGGEIDTSHLRLYIETSSDPQHALVVTKRVLAEAEVLDLSFIILETSSPSDPDDRDWRVLWPENHAGALPVG
ncbi:MAG TPA: hypothetical protein VLM40_10845 [Gemmata sp.]|nr:hypothetical protein [Gemmata sp.]